MECDEKQNKKVFTSLFFLGILPQFDSVSFYMFQMDKPQHPYDDIPIFHNLTRLELYDNWELVAQVLQPALSFKILNFTRFVKSMNHIRFILS
jgi:hypothetical protein